MKNQHTVSDVQRGVDVDDVVIHGKACVKKEVTNQKIVFESREVIDKNDDDVGKILVMVDD